MKTMHSAKSNNLKSIKNLVLALIICIIAPSTYAQKNQHYLNFSDSSPLFDDRFTSVLSYKDRYQEMKESTIVKFDRINSQLEKPPYYYGLFLSTELQQDVETPDYGTTVTLYWELLKNGWRESHKEYKKARTEISIQQIQLLNALHHQQKETFRFHANKVNNKIQQICHQNEYAYLSSLSKKKKHQLDKGFITINVFEEFKFQLDQSKNQHALYQSLSSEGLSKNDRKILNQLPNLNILPLKDLYASAEKRSLKVKMNKKRLESSDYQRDYWDEASLKLYVTHQDPIRNYIDSRNIVGFKVQLPVGYNNHLSRISESKKSNYEINIATSLIELNEKLTIAYDRLQTSKAELKSLVKEEVFLREKRRHWLELLNENLNTNKHDIEKQLENVQFKILKSHRNILEKRLEIYKHLYEISWIAHTTTDTIIVNP